MQNAFQICSNSKVFTIPSLFKHLLDISPDISNSLVFGQNHYYCLKSKVNENVFQSFIDYLVDDKIPDIDVFNFNEFMQLSQEFNILIEFLEDKKKQLGEYLIYINGLLTNKNENSTFYEEQIAIKLDDYLEKFGEELFNIPIQSLYNIFNHPRRNLTQHNAAYDLIKQYLDKTKNENAFILFDALDGTKLSKSNIEESFALREKRLNHMPSVDFSYLADEFANRRKLEDKINELEKKITETQNQNEIDKKNLNDKFELDKKEIVSNYEAEIKSLSEKHAKEIELMNDKIEWLSKQIGENEKKNDAEIQSIKEMLAADIESIQASVSDNFSKSHRLKKKPNYKKFIPKISFEQESPKLPPPPPPSPP
ncbi:hypothetical protein M9Y10_038475 [Tritrichomonas musculus]|uniref:Uncharacterized protein n=1 Tax=Tritrichomonas musculus TaxID=1915356 RepID=A0ABR2K963_9EUKA